ncbi:MAG: septum formation initiator family protein [Bacteroidota bacterium]
MQQLWQKLPRWARNSYLLIGASFLVWMAFFDAEDLFTQYRLWRKLSDLQAERRYYEEQIDKVRQDQEGLTTNQELLERFAREKYFMKKKTEDLYIIVD